MNLVELPIDPKRLRTATQLLSRTMDVMIEANETLQLQTIREGDIRIDVHMGDITTADFERVPDTIPLGEAAAREHASELVAYAVPEAQYAAWRTSVTRSQDLETRLADVRFEGLKRRLETVGSAASEKWMWHELPSSSLNLAMKVIAMSIYAAISLAPFL